MIHLLTAEGINELIGELFSGEITELPYAEKNAMFHNMVCEGVRSSSS